MATQPADDSDSNPSASRAHPRRARRSGKILRVAGWLLFVPICLGLLVASAAVLYARTDAGRERIRKLAVAKARQSVPGLSIGFVGGDYVHDLWLRDVDVRDDQGTVAVHADRVAVRYRLWSLIHRTVAVHELDLDGVRIAAHPDPRGGLNLEHLTAPSSSAARPTDKPAASAWTVRLDRIRVGVVRASLEQPDGSIAAIQDLSLDGGLDLEGERTRVRIANLAAAANWNETATTLSLSDLSLDLDRLTVKAAVPALRLTGLLRAGVPLDLRASAEGPLDRVRASLDLTGGGAQVGLTGVAGLSADDTGARTLGAYDLHLAGRGIDPAEVASNALAGQVGFQIRAQGQGVPLAPASSARLDIQLLPSTVAGIAIAGAQLAATARGQSWVLLPSSLKAPGISLALEGHGAGHQVTADLEIKADGSPVRFDSRGFDGRGRGKVALHAAGEWPGRVAVRAHGDLRGLRAEAVRLEALKLDADFRVEQPAGGGAPTFDARAQMRVSGLVVGDKGAASADLTLAAQGTPERPSGTARVGARRVRAGAGAPQIDTFTLRAAGNQGSVRVDAAISGPRLRGGLQAHGMASARAADVSLDGLSLDVTTHSYRQTINLQQPARLTYRAGDEVAVQHLSVKGTGAKFTGQAVVSGAYRLPPSRREPLASVEIQGAGVSIGGLPPTDLRMNGTLTRKSAEVNLDAQMPTAGATLHLDSIVPVIIARDGSPRLSPRGDVTLHLKSNEVRLQSIPSVERILARQGITGGTVAANLAVSGDINHPDARGSFDVRDVMYRNIAGLGRDSTLKTVPGLGGSIKIDTKPGDIRVDAELLIRKAGVLEVSAHTPVDLGRLIAGLDLPTLPIKATLTIPRFSLKSLSDFTDELVGIEGQLEGHAEVTGTVGRPSGRADLSVASAAVDDVKFRQVHLVAEGDKGRVQAQLTLDQLSGGQLDGKLSLDRGHDDRIQATLTGRDLDVGFVRPFLTSVREIAGKSQLSATATGTLQAPRVSASLSLENGRLGVIGQPTFQGIQVAAALSPGRADLQKVELHSGGGSLTGKGWAILGGPGGLSPRSVVFTAHAHRFLVATAGSTGARIDGDLAAEGALRADILTGKVDVPDANVWLPQGPPTGGGRDLQKIGPHPDVHFVDQTALAAEQRARDKRRQAAASGFRLAVEASAKPVYIRGKDLDIEVRSDVQIATVATGPHAGAPTITGGIHIPRGRINIQGQRFDFDHGNVTFNGSYELNPELDIKLTRQFPEALVVIELHGTPKKPELRMSSDPAVYDQAQIVSLILTGSPGGQPSSGKGFDPTAAVATAVLGKLADQVAPALGLDVMRVEGQDVKNAQGDATGDTDTRVEVGKYITERIYLSYAHIFGAPDDANQNEAHVEYRMTRRLIMESVFGDAGQGGVDALWTYRF
jgi:autotransporter translocation and assembly factor TamB